jgi:hypothetical protein
VIEGEFEDAIGTKTIGFSHGDFGLVVQTLHDSAGNEFLSAEVVQDEFPMLPGDFLEGLNARSHGLAAPLLEKLAGPSRRVVFPEFLKGLLEEVSADRFQVVPEETAEPEMLFGAEALSAPEQQPT